MRRIIFGLGTLAAVVCCVLFVSSPIVAFAPIELLPVLATVALLAIAPATPWALKNLVLGGMAREAALSGVVDRTAYPPPQTGLPQLTSFG